MRKWLAIPLVLIVLVMMIGSCGNTVTTTPSASPTGTTAPPPPTKVAPFGQIVTALTDFSAEAIDPTLYESIWGWSMYDSLITTNSEGKFIGEVAKSWAVSPDGLTWTFTIRDDIKFWDGTPLTAQDVLFTMTRFTSEASTNPWSSGLRANMESISAPNDSTFVFKTVKPELPLSTSFAATRILPKAYFEKVGEKGFTDNPMGSGPWIFVEHTPETSFTMRANENYWDPANVPVYATVKEIQVPEEATQIAMFRNGEVDLPMGVTTSQRVALEKEGFKSVQIGLMAPVVLNIQGTWRPEAGPTHDIRIREALSLAINRQELCDTIYEGQATPGGLFALQPGGFGVTDALIKADPYDVTKAKKLMADAGYPGAFANPVIHVYTTAGPAMELLQAIQQYWVDAGFQVNIEILEATVWLAYFFNTPIVNGDEPNIGWMWSWTGGAADSTYMQKNLLTSEGAHQMLKDPAVDKLYADYLSNTDPNKAFDMFNAFLTAGFSQRICIGLVMTKPMVLASDKLGAFTTNTWLYYADAYSGIRHPAGATPENPTGK
jgi:peptide/nickel transport system substrate-binding protein